MSRVHLAVLRPPLTPDLLNEAYAIDRDYDLVTAAQAGSAEAFGDLYQAHSSAIIGKLVALSGGDRGLAEDLTQETFIKAFRSLDQFRNKTNGAKGWLATIARHTFIDNQRARARRPVEYQAEPRMLETTYQSSVDETVIPRLEVERLLTVLPLARRAVVEAVYRWDLSYQQTADLLGVPIGTIRSSLHRALQQMEASD